MRGFRFRSIRTRMIAITMLAFAAVVVILAATAVVASRGALQASIKADLRRRGENFAAVILRDSQRDSRRGAPPQGGPLQGGPPGGGPPGGGFPGGPPGAGRRQLDSSWTAPAHIRADSKGRGAGASEEPYDPKGYADALKGRDGFTTVLVDGDEPRLVFSVPVQNTGKVQDVVQVAASMRTAMDQLELLRRTLLTTVVPLGLALGALASFLVVDRLLLPLRRLNGEALRIGREGFGERLEPLGDDEFASLTVTLNGMIGNLEEVYRSERDANARLQESVERQRRFTGDASHEIKTPLSVIKAHLGILKRSRRNVADEADTIQAMDRAADRMAALVRDLLVLARSDSGIAGERSPCRLDAILREAVEAIPGSEGRVRLAPLPSVTVQGSPDELHRLFSNLVENALKHSGAEAPVAVELSVRDGAAVATVTDAGVGIAPEHLPHLFERFYRVDRSRASASGGTGLGLAICEQIARGHGGEIEVESAAGKGTRFTVTLPVSDVPTEKNEREALAPHPP